MGKFDFYEMPDTDQMDRYWRESVYSGDQQREFTFRAVAAGIFIGVVMVAVNIYMGFKTGFGEGGSITCAVFGAVLFNFVIVRLLKDSYTPLENNMTQTVGSAAGSIGNVVTVIPAFFILEKVLGYHLGWGQIFWFVLSTSLLGVFFAVPLRKQIIVKERLVFPSGTACAELITILHERGTAARIKGKLLGIFALVSGIIKWLQSGVPRVIPELSMLPGKIFNVPFAKLTVGCAWSPLLIGAGFLVGPRLGISIMLGAVVTFPILAPWLAGQGWITEIGYRPIIFWTMWPGVALMIADGLVALGLKWRVFLDTFKDMRSIVKGEGDGLEMPFKTWILCLSGAFIFNIIVMKWILAVPVWMTFISLLMSFILSAIAMRAIGQTEINPVSAMASITQLVYGFVAPGNMTVNLAMAGNAGAGASEAGDMGQDLKTGYLLGATPRRQVWGQVIGVLTGALAAVPMLYLIINTYGIGTETMPAPSAIRFAALTRVLAEGISALPPGCLVASVIAAIIGAILPFLEKTRFKPYLPSAVGLGIAMIIPFFYSASIFLGAMILVITRQVARKRIEDNKYMIGAAAIAGESIIGMIIAVLILSKIIPA